MTASSLVRSFVVVLLLTVSAPGIAQEASPPRERPRVAIALGGGSARGLAHIGVLKWLEEHRVPVDAIAGTSMGAFVGGAYASGFTASEIQALLNAEDWEAMTGGVLPYELRSFRRKEDYRDYAIKIELGLRHGLRLQGGLNSGHRLGLFLSRTVLPYSAIESFDELPIPFRCTATDMEAGKTVVLERGPLAPALRASMALPGTFDPVLLDGRWLSDGGILNNLPVDVARSMGADVVIAVSVARPRQGEKSEGFGVVYRAVQLMMSELDQPRQRDADVVIQPDVAGVSSSAFLESDDIIARGYAAAEAQAAALTRYSLSPIEWDAYRARVRSRRQPRTGTFQFVRVFGVSEKAGAQISERITEDLAGGADPRLIDAQLDWLVGHGQYASAMYARKVLDGREGLIVEVRDKSYAPPLVKFAVDLDNEDQDINLTMGSRITMLDVTSLGSEVRIDASFGSTQRLGIELLQPVGRGFMRRGPFVAPHAAYTRSSEHIYDGDAIAAIYNRRRTSVGLDAGWLFGRVGQLRLGYETAHAKNSERVGSGFPNSSGREELVFAAFDVDTRNRPYFPSSGARLHARSTWFRRTPDSVSGFGLVEGEASASRQLRDGLHATLFADGGTSFNGTPPSLYQYGVGGAARLSAFAPNELRGPKYFVGGVGIRKEISRLPALLGDRLYLTGRLEAGGAFSRFDTARFHTSATAGLAADTIFGPFFIGAAVGKEGAVRVYFIVGKAVR